jgi:hypothetical protein
VKDSVVIEVHDTIAETKTITITKNEAGDTLKLSTVTERDRVRFATQLKDKSEKIKVVHDTVFVAKRDSVLTTNRTNETNGRASPVVLTLKWGFWIIIAIIALIVTIKLSRIIRIKN